MADAFELFPLGDVRVDDNTDALYVVDRSTGAASRIARFTTTNGAGPNSPSGLEFVGSTLYMANSNPDAFYTVDRNTARATLFRSVTLNNLAGLAWNGTTLYAVNDGVGTSADPDALYTLPRIVTTSNNNPTSSYWPNEGDLYYNGDVFNGSGVHSYSFIDSVMKWDNPAWESDKNTGNNVCTTDVQENCSTYEQDIKLDSNWVRVGQCTTWASFEHFYDDCITSTIGGPQGKRLVAFGTQ